MAFYEGLGTTFARGDSASPEVFTAIGQVASIGAVSLNRGEIPVTHLSSTFDSIRKSIKSGAAFDLTILYDPDDTGHSGLRTDWGSNTPRNYRITLTDSPAQTITIKALVTNWQINEVTPDNVFSLTVTLRPTDTEPTFA